ncbi:MAG: glutathione S-transferase, partial [Sphingosinicella sp.]
IGALVKAVEGGPYLCGEHFTAADVYLGSQIGWGMLFGALEKKPALEAYFGRLQQRPAHQRSRELDDALMPPQAQPQAEPQPA